ncbi:MAG TPA: archease [Dissulfurispiraceae bacterium]|nr:archease [Dissulfurispiraceae bacterium]
MFIGISNSHAKKLRQRNRLFFRRAGFASAVGSAGSIPQIGNVFWFRASLAGCQALAEKLPLGENKRMRQSSLRMPYQVLDAAGDAGISAEGASCGEALQNAGMALFSLITDPGRVREEESIAFHVDAESRDVLLVRVLNELIFLFDTEDIVASRIEMDDAGACTKQDGVFHASGRIWGERFSSDRHERRLLVKAATYHNLVFAPCGNLWRVEVIFDI